MFEEGVSPAQMTLILQGIAEMLNAAQVGNNVQVKNFGVWRNTNYVSGNTLLAFQSVDWYVTHAMDRARNQIHCGKLAKSLRIEPWQEAQPHYDVLVLKSDLYDGDVDWCFGYSIPGQAITSVHRFEKWLSDDRYIQDECFKTVVMHEIGHMLGIVDETRKDITYNLGWHCIHPNCIMRQSENIDLCQLHTYDRLISEQTLCPSCQRDLRNHVLSLNQKAVVS
jgi:predicted Zn-dependent protease